MNVLQNEIVGIDFGAGGEGYLRLSYANSLENLAEALDRLKTYLEQRSPARKS